MKAVEVELPLQPTAGNHEHHDGQERVDGDSLLEFRPVHRYREYLAELRIQLERHSADVDMLLKPGPSGNPTLPETVTRDHTSTSEDLRALDKQARIERLRRDGWQRKRFDASRYERLCEAVLAELN
jgi:hypothetical protein